MNRQGPLNIIRRAVRQTPFEDIRATTLNTAADGVNRLVEGQYRAPRQITPSGRQIQQSDEFMSIRGIFSDVLLCFAESDQSLVYVARPPLLRSTSLTHTNAKGTTLTFTYTGEQTRQATDGSTVENQILVQAYNLNDVILVRGLIDTGIEFPEGEPVEWVDMNIDARNWATDVS